MKALIIDDEIDICYLLSSILKIKNIQSYYVNTLAAVSDALKTQQPEIVFLDNHLPDGNGVEFVETIRRCNPHTKIIMITAYDTLADRKKAALKGVDFFIAKPFTRDTIYQAINLFTS